MLFSLLRDYFVHFHIKIVRHATNLFFISFFYVLGDLVLALLLGAILTRLLCIL